MVARIAEARNLLSKRLGRLPTDNEIAEVLNVHTSTVRLVSERSRPPISLDQAVTDRGFMTLQVLVLLCHVSFLLVIHVSFGPC
jgi:DNA-directed RNA polymerase sigma subunit (sigma70/sigma32)